MYMASQVPTVLDAYRDTAGWAVAAAQADQLEAQRRAEIATVPAALCQLYQHRQARIVAGAVGATAAVAMFAALAVSNRGLPTLVLIGAWPAMAFAYAVAFVAARYRLRRTLQQSVWRTDDVFCDLRRLECDGLAPAAVAEDRASRQAHASYALPLVAAAVLGPLTLHLFVASLFPEPLSAADFADWMKLTAMFTGPAHAYAVWAAWQFPRRRRPFQPAAGAALWAIIPGAIALFIPPVIVLVTGAVIAALCFVPMGALIDRENALLASRPPADART